MNAPHILTYQNIVSYFQDYYSYRKNKDTRFSYEIWSTELNYSSRSFLKMICIGKRKTTHDFVKRFSEKNSLSSIEKQHLILLSKSQSAEMIEFKKICDDKILETLYLDSHRLEIKNAASFLQSLQRPLFQMLLSFKDFKVTLKNIKKALGIDEEIALKELEYLTEQGLAQKNEDQWNAPALSYRAPGIEEIKDFHHKTLDEVRSQIENIHQPDKKFRSIYFTANPEQIAELSTDVEDFLKKIRNKYGSNFVDQKKIVKLNLNFYNLTDTLNANLDKSELTTTLINT